MDKLTISRRSSTSSSLIKSTAESVRGTFLHRRADRSPVWARQSKLPPLRSGRLGIISKMNHDDDVYRALVVDSGPIIRLTGLSNLRGKALGYYTVPAVMQEIRDAKARQHLEQLPFELIPREPSPKAIQAVIEFAKKTGDYHSLSTVDVQVLALLYDLECEGCDDRSHIRTTPKRTAGVGKIKLLAPKNGGDEESLSTKDTVANLPSGEDFFQEADIFDDDDDASSSDDDDDDEDDINHGDGSHSARENSKDDGPENIAEPNSSAAVPIIKSWAMLVNPKVASKSLPVETPSPVEESAKKLKVVKISDDSSGGQFSDADDDEDSIINDNKVEATGENDDVDEELKLEFPSLHASLAVPYNEEEDTAFMKANAAPSSVVTAKPLTEEEHERRKQESLRPISKSGKMYNSLRKYDKLLKAKKPVQRDSPGEEKKQEQIEESKTEPAEMADSDADDTKVQSRILGGEGGAIDEDDFDDDGEGWITCARDLRSMKANGSLDPSRNPNDLNSSSPTVVGPPKSQRAACTTTDFAMQNVILQMNLELVSVDGIRIRRLKSWVTRCGACFKIYSSSSMSEGPTGMKRLFCSHCGSDMMQRIAASVDSKNGRLRLHMSRKYKNNFRGTKYSLPKPGSGNRFQGDLLLREDQLLTGAWNQKVKIRSGGKSRAAAQSIFGKDLASNVGCAPTASGTDDIRVGFGRRNPNAAKGRERRGKKKKSSDKACGLRRY